MKLSTTCRRRRRQRQRQQRYTSGSNSSHATLACRQRPQPRPLCAMARCHYRWPPLHPPHPSQPPRRPVPLARRRGSCWAHHLGAAAPWLCWLRLVSLCPPLPLRLPPSYSLSSSPSLAFFSLFASLFFSLFFYHSSPPSLSLHHAPASSPHLPPPPYADSRLADPSSLCPLAPRVGLAWRLVRRTQRGPCRVRAVRALDGRPVRPRQASHLARRPAVPPPLQIRLRSSVGQACL